MKLIALSLACAATLGSAAIFGREYRAAYFARGTELSAFGALASGVGIPAVPPSSRSMRELFETCGAVQQSNTYAFQPRDTKLAVDASCASLARAALKRNPTHGGAHTILMLSSDTDEGIAGSLVLSQLTAPLEAWHARLRLRKGLALYGSGKAKLDRALDLDIAFMVQSWAGREWLARLYQAEPAFRPTLVATLERGPDAFKAGFLQEVRRLGQ